jgi:hypothetical protein
MCLRSYAISVAMGEAGRGYWDEEELGHGIVDRIKCETTPLG